MSLLNTPSDFSLSVDGSELTLSWTDCCSSETQTAMVNLGNIGSGGGSGAFTYIRDESGSAAPGAPVAPATPPGTPVTSDTVIEVWDDKTLLWTYNGASWTLVASQITGPLLKAAETSLDKFNTAAWDVNPGRFTFIYDGDANSNNPLIGITDDDGNAHPISQTVYWEITNGATGIGSNVENPTTSEILVYLLANAKPLPYAGDIIEYTAPSGNVYVYDVTKDDSSANYVFERRSGGSGFLRVTGGGIDGEDKTTWPSQAPSLNWVVDSARSLVRGVVGPSGNKYRIPRTWHIEVGKAGLVDTDTKATADLPATPAAITHTSWIVNAECAMSAAPSANTTFRLYRFATLGGAGTLIGNWTITAGQRTTSLASLVGEQIPTGSYLVCEVTSGSDGEDLVISLNIEG